MKKNVAWIVRNGLCLGCGVCQDACKKGCIRIAHGKDLNTPKVDEENCVECGLCMKVCSGKGFKIGKVSSELFKGDSFDDKIGYYHRCYTGHSMRQEWRYHAASGGCLTTFLIYLLRHKLIDGAAVVDYHYDHPMQPRPVIARTPKEIYACRGSKYCVVSVEGICKEIVEKGGKYVVVGLPCHIQSYRNFAAINRRFRVHKLAARAKQPSATEWECFFEETSKQTPAFHTEITKENINLTSQERRVCLLTRLHFIPSEICALLNISPQRLTNLRSGINGKLFQGKGAKQFDDNIRHMAL